MFLYLPDDEPGKRGCRVVNCLECWIMPGDTMEGGYFQWPEEWRREIISVRWNINKDMQKPAAHFPDWFFTNGPDEEEDEKENDKTMTNTV